MTDVEDYIRQLGELLARDAPFCVLLDTRAVTNVDVGRKSLGLFADLYRNERDACQQQWVGLSLVLKSTGIRFLFSSLLLMVRLPMPYRLLESENEAKAFLAECLAQRGLMVPDELTLAR